MKAVRESLLNSPGNHFWSKSTTNLIAHKNTKRDLTVGMVGKSMAEGNSKELKHVLRHVGSQDQGLATKIVQLNRDEFLKRLTLGK